MNSREDIEKFFVYDELAGAFRRILPKGGISKRTVGFSASRGYRKVDLHGKGYFEHRLVFLWHHNYLPEIIDHIDGNKTNNRIENLRACNNQQNLWGMKCRRDSQSGIKGVRQLPSGRWHCMIKINRKTVVLGTFDSSEEAVDAFNREAKKHRGEFSKL